MVESTAGSVYSVEYREINQVLHPQMNVRRIPYALAAFAQLEENFPGLQLLARNVPV